VSPLNFLHTFTKCKKIVTKSFSLQEYLKVASVVHATHCKPPHHQSTTWTKAKSEFYKVIVMLPFIGSPCCTVHTLTAWCIRTITTNDECASNELGMLLSFTTLVFESWISSQKLICFAMITYNLWMLQQFICTYIQTYVCTCKRTYVHVHCWSIHKFSNSLPGFPPSSHLMKIQRCSQQNYALETGTFPFPPTWNISTTSGINHKQPDNAVVGVAYQIGSYCQNQIWCWAENHPCLSQR